MPELIVHLDRDTYVSVADGFATVRHGDDEVRFTGSVSNIEVLADRLLNGAEAVRAVQRGSAPPYSPPPRGHVWTGD